jgi:hypothetical protein
MFAADGQVLSSIDQVSAGSESMRRGLHRARPSRSPRCCRALGLDPDIGVDERLRFRDTGGQGLIHALECEIMRRNAPISANID